MRLLTIFVSGIILGAFAYPDSAADSPKSAIPDQRGSLVVARTAPSCNTKNCPNGMCHMDICRPTTPKPCDENNCKTHCVYGMCLPNKSKM